MTHLNYAIAPGVVDKKTRRLNAKIVKVADVCHLFVTVVHKVGHVHFRVQKWQLGRTKGRVKNWAGSFEPKKLYTNKPYLT